jgi:hypothetical protein
MTRALPLAALLALSVAAAGGAQSRSGGRCRFNFEAPNRPLNLLKQPSGQYNMWAGGNVVGRCAAKGQVVTADSIEYYGDEGRTVLIGRATYRDARLRLSSTTLTYFEPDERILAIENVVGTLPSGSTIRGPQLEFLRAVPRIRPQQMATAIGRPTISLVERDAQGRAQPPVRITGNTVWMQGDSIVAASGSVVVVRPQLTATGDSLYADAGQGLLRMMRSPRIVGTRGRPFTLVGETIDLLTRRRRLERVLAKSKAEAQSEELNLRSDTIDMRVTDDLLQRAIVWGTGRAVATSPTQSVTADSIDVLLPGQRVRQLNAVRGAVAMGAPDTTHIVTTERDRLTGDTIIAWFDSIPARDTVTRPQIRQLRSMGSATSLRFVAPADTTLCAPRIVYARGRLIDVSFAAGVVDSVQVVDPVQLASGAYLDPRPDSANRCSVLRPRPAAPAGGVVGPAGAPPATQPAAPARPLPGRPATAPAGPPATAAAPDRRR